jgi:hypothetical protein
MPSCPRALVPSCPRALVPSCPRALVQLKMPLPRLLLPHLLEHHSKAALANARYTLCATGTGRHRMPPPPHAAATACRPPTDPREARVSSRLSSLPLASLLFGCRAFAPCLCAVPLRRLTVNGTSFGGFDIVKDARSLASSFPPLPGAEAVRVVVTLATPMANGDDGSRDGSLAASAFSSILEEEVCVIVEFRDHLGQHIASGGCVLERRLWGKPLYKVAIEPAFRAACSAICEGGGDVSKHIERVSVGGHPVADWRRGAKVDSFDSFAEGQPACKVVVHLHASSLPSTFLIDVCAHGTGQVLLQMETTLTVRQLRQPLARALIGPVLEYAGALPRPSPEDAGLRTCLVHTDGISEDAIEGPRLHKERAADLLEGQRRDRGVAPTAVRVTLPQGCLAVSVLPSSFVVSILHRTDEISCLGADISSPAWLEMPLSEALIRPALSSHLKSAKAGSEDAPPLDLRAQRNFKALLGKKQLETLVGVSVDGQSCDITKSVRALAVEGFMRPPRGGGRGKEGGEEGGEEEDYEPYVEIHLPDVQCAGEPTVVPFHLTIMLPPAGDSLAAPQPIELVTSLRNAWIKKSLLDGLLLPALRAHGLPESGFMQSVTVNDKQVDEGGAMALTSVDVALPYGQPVKVVVHGGRARAKLPEEERPPTRTGLAGLGLF